MSMSGILRQIDEGKLRELLKNPDDVLAFTNETVPASEEMDLNKAWHGLHFMLTGEAWGGEEPCCYLVSGGEQIGDEEDHDVGYGPARGINTRQVIFFSTTLNGITERNFINRYDGRKMMALELYPRGWEEEPAEMKAWLMQEFAALQNFVRNAAEHNKALLIWLQ